MSTTQTELAPEKTVAATPAAVPAVKKTVKDHLNSPAFMEAVKKTLPKHLTADRFVRIAIMAVTRTPKLMQCELPGLLGALMQLSQFGLEPDGRRAHLIPFNNRKRGVVECQLIIDYKGIAELVMRSGLVSYIHADVVCDKDVFRENVGEIVEHTINRREPRGKVYAVYALCRFKDGTAKADVMSFEEVEAVRHRSKSGEDGPWITDWNEMAKKTVFRRLSKWLPLSAEIREVVEADDDLTEKREIKVEPVSMSEMLGGGENADLLQVEETVKEANSDAP